MTPAIAQLANLLQEAKAPVELRPDAVVPSAIYDPLYRATVVACTLAQWVKGGQHRINGTLLRLVQFVAIRPNLLSNFTTWLAARQQKRLTELELWSFFPHGYIADATHTMVLEYLRPRVRLRRSERTSSCRKTRSFFRIWQKRSRC